MASATRLLKNWAPDSRRRTARAIFIYVVTTTVFAIVAGPQRLGEHTAFNHYAHLADAWLHGRQWIVHGGPSYAMGNDFAEFGGKTYISFPPFPAVLMLPLVWLAGSPENFRDGQFIVWLAGLGPALLFLVFERLRTTGRSSRTEAENIFLSGLFAFGTVYFFTAVEGTVWFAAHVVAVSLAALYLLCALDARRPALSGLLIGCAFATRPFMIFTGLLFVLEAIRVTCKELPTEGTLRERMEKTYKAVDRPAFARLLVAFAVPLLGVLALCSWTNYTRFGDLNPGAFGHEHLTVVWAKRMTVWGIIGYHYLAKNLGVMLTVLPFAPQRGTMCFSHQGGVKDAIFHFNDCVPFRINEHGLALWFTSPFYFWLFRPKVKGYLYAAVGASIALTVLLDLLYQNSGWRQFGYRFSNDYAPFLFVLLAIGARPFGKLFKAVVVWSVAWNLFGALTFDRGYYDKFYFREASQRELYQPD
jgi:hypothetical protein